MDLYVYGFQVVKVYDSIAVHWNHTRGRRKVYWHRVKQFIEDLPPGTLLADIGEIPTRSYHAAEPNLDYLLTGRQRRRQVFDGRYKSERSTGEGGAVEGDDGVHSQPGDHRTRLR